jgi:hypothetical protein
LKHNDIQRNFCYRFSVFIVVGNNNYSQLFVPVKTNNSRTL